MPGTQKTKNQNRKKKSEDFQKFSHSVKDKRKRIIILGAGQVGRHLVRILARDGYNVILIDTKDDRIAEALANSDVGTIKADGLDPKIYKDLNLGPDDAFIAVTTADETNLLACSIVKSFGCHLNIARVRNIYFSSDEKAMLNEEFWRSIGVEILFNQTELTIKEVLHLLENPGAEEVFALHDPRVQMIAYRVRSNSLLCGRRIMGLSEVPIFNNLIVAAVSTTLGDSKGEKKNKNFFIKGMHRTAIRKHHVSEDVTIIPDGNYQIKEGDLVFVCGIKENFKNLGQIFDRNISSNKKHIFIYGGSTLALNLAKSIHLKYPSKSIYLIEPNKQNAFLLSDKVGRDINVLLGGIHNIDTYKNEGLDKHCVFIGASPIEDDNILSSILIKEETQARTIAIVQKPTNKHLIPFLEIDAAVSPKLLLVDEVLHSLQKSMFEVLSAKGNDTEMIEFTVKKTAAIANKQLRDIPFPKDSIICTIFRGEQIIIPRGTTKIHPGDHVAVFTLKKVIQEVQTFFASNA